jgi:TolA-binding protein
MPHSSTQITYPQRRSSKRTSRWLFLALMTGMFLTAYVGGCAYFNMFYNAKEAYRDAEATPRASDGTASRTAFAQYDKVIEKCQNLIRTYPDSKYVDDAILLMGKAYYEKGEYDDAILKFNELKENFPKSELNAEGQLFLGKAYFRKDNDEAAIKALETLYAQKPNQFGDEILYLLGTLLIRQNREEDAVVYLEKLATKYPNSQYRIDADMGIADVYLQRGEYNKSLEIYKKLGTLKLSEENEIRYLRKLAETQVSMKRFAASMFTFRKLGKHTLQPTDEAQTLLLKGQAYAGLDSLQRAIDTYSSVAASYPRSAFSAEAGFRMGVIYQEKLDSLDVAKTKFDMVPRQYANSPFAEEAVRRSVSISKLLDLRANLGKGDVEGKAASEFDIAEVQLFQFSDYPKALAGYQTVLDSFPTSDLGPRAAYAIAYIYDVLMNDENKARSAYELLIAKYPESQQAEYARRFLNRPVNSSADSSAAGDTLRENSP